MNPLSLARFGLFSTWEKDELLIFGATGAGSNPGASCEVVSRVEFGATTDE